MSDLLYKKNRKFYILLILPALALYCFGLVGPLLAGTIPSSFYDWNLIEENKDWIGFGNYVKLFSDTTFLHSLLFTMILAVFTIIGTNILAFFVAFLLNEKIFGKTVSRAMFFIPNIISGVMVAFVWIFIFTGAIPSVAESIGLESLANVSWFGTPTMATVSVIIVSVWQGTGFLMMLYLAGLQTIPQDVLEASTLDGCTGLKKIIKIQLPLLMSTVTINLFVSIAGAFKAFDIPFALTAGGPSKSTQTVALNIYNDAFGSFKTGYGSAKSVILFLIIAIVTIIQLSITRKREVEA